MSENKQYKVMVEGGEGDSKFNTLVRTHSDIDDVYKTYHNVVRGFRAAGYTKGESWTRFSTETLTGGLVAYTEVSKNELLTVYIAEVDIPCQKCRRLSERIVKLEGKTPNLIERERFMARSLGLLAEFMSEQGNTHVFLPDLKALRDWHLSYRELGIGGMMEL